MHGFNDAEIYDRVQIANSYTSQTKDNRMTSSTKSSQQSPSSTKPPSEIEGKTINDSSALEQNGVLAINMSKSNLLKLENLDLIVGTRRRDVEPAEKIGKVQSNSREIIGTY